MRVGDRKLVPINKKVERRDARVSQIILFFQIFNKK